MYINERDYQAYNSILNLTIPFRQNYQESIRHFFDHNIRFVNLDYNDGMDFIRRKFEHEEFEEYTISNSYRVLDNNVRYLYNNVSHLSYEERERRIRRAHAKLMGERERLHTELKMRARINGIR